MFDVPSFRATVVHSNSTTGEIRVLIPTLAGTDATVPISYVGRSATNGVWAVPTIGSQIVVTTSDPRLNNVYWLQVQPSTVSLTSIENDIVEVQNKLDSLFLGIFS